MVGGPGGAPVARGVLAAGHRTGGAGPGAGPWRSGAGAGPHSGQLRPEMVSRTLVMISAGIGA